ncbi:MAG: hypothetical protein COB53_00480 [Elusimicrobia bacterium]|nr:MAG: hypothetical protein COB53_00480 [Elusimicrobiota bacterium]
MIGYGDNRGRWIFVIIAIFAVVGDLLGRFTDIPREQAQTVMIIILLPVAFLTFWKLRTPQSGVPAERGNLDPVEPASSDRE